MGACEEGREEEQEEEGGCLLGLLNLVSPGSLCNYGVLLRMRPTLSLPKCWSSVVMVSDACICREDYG